MPKTFGSLSLNNGQLKNDYTSFIPAWHSEVWNKYANRLRVYGTQEEVFLLDRSEPIEGPPGNGASSEG